MPAEISTEATLLTVKADTAAIHSELSALHTTLAAILNILLDVHDVQKHSLFTTGV